MKTQMLATHTKAREAETLTPLNKGSCHELPIACEAECMENKTMQGKPGICADRCQINSQGLICSNYLSPPLSAGKPCNGSPNRVSTDMRQKNACERAIHSSIPSSLPRPRSPSHSLFLPLLTDTYPGSMLWTCL